MPRLGLERSKSHSKRLSYLSPVPSQSLGFYCCLEQHILLCWPSSPARSRTSRLSIRGSIARQAFGLVMMDVVWMGSNACLSLARPTISVVLLNATALFSRILVQSVANKSCINL